MAEVLSVVPELFEQLLDAVTAFEKRHGLWADGDGSPASDPQPSS